MKHTLRYCIILLALATTGLFAETVTEPVATSTTGPHTISKGAKKGHKAGHKKHRRHKKAAQ